MNASFFDRVELLTNEFWQPTGALIQTRLEDNLFPDNEPLWKDVVDFIDTAEFVRFYLGVRAEWTEWMDDSNLDEFSDIVFYLARCYNFLNIKDQIITFNALPLDRANKYLDKMDQPVRNMLRPSPLKDKHRKILVENMKRFTGCVMAHKAFKGYSDDDVINTLVVKLAPRYNK